MVHWYAVNHNQPTTAAIVYIHIRCICWCVVGMHPVMVRSYDGGTDLVVLGSDDSGLLFLLCLIVALILFAIYKLLQL